MSEDDISGYRYDSASLGCSHEYLIPPLLQVLAELSTDLGGGGRRLFELGCGNGSVANLLTELGWDVTGVDPSREGIAIAQRHYPRCKLHPGSAYDALSAAYGTFPVVISLEVVEHVYAPRHYARTLFELVEPGGVAIVSTPYHGYWKNLALALSGRLDRHFTALWDHGHIKFWSIETLGTLLMEAGFVDIWFRRVGRVPALAKSMIAVARKPSSCQQETTRNSR